VEQGLDEVEGGSGSGVGGGDGGHLYLGGVPFDGVDGAFGGGLGDPYAVAAVVMHSWREIPAFDGMRCPGVSDCRLDVNEDAGPRWGQRRAIVVEGAVDLGIGREARVDAGAAEKVEGDEGLWKETIPKVQGKVGVGAAEASNEMIFERPNGTFGGIASVDAGRGELEVDVDAGDVLAEGEGSFVVELLQ
jgi:hypothetical protein